MVRPQIFSSVGSIKVVLVKHEGTEEEERHELDAVVQATKGFFAVDAPVDPGDVVLSPSPRGGTSRRSVARVLVHEAPPRMNASMSHTTAEWGDPPPIRATPPRRLELEGLHRTVIEASSGLFGDGHFSQAIFEACKAIEVRVRDQSGLDYGGRDLMVKALSGDEPAINVAVESGQSGRDEQEGIRFMLMGLMQGVRNPKGHGLVAQDDPQRALEYLAVVSILLRRLDDAAGA
jgi:uncharacterized protein (TIGR02391 family)